MTVVMAQAATSFTVEAPRQVIEGNKFNVTFVLNNGEGSSFTPPEVTGAKLIYGPSVSHSYSSSWVNGKSSSSSSEEYTMIYKATSTGKCHIGPATIVVGGKRMATKADHSRCAHALQRPHEPDGRQGSEQQGPVRAHPAVQAPRL